MPNSVRGIADAIYAHESRVESARVKAAQMADTAETMFNVMSALVSAGFTREEAMQLLVASAGSR